MFGAVMNFVCLTCAAVRSEQWAPPVWASFAALDFHRPAKRGAALWLMLVDVPKSISPASAVRGKPSQDTSFCPCRAVGAAHPITHLLVTLLCTPRQLPLAQPLCLPAKAASGSPSRALHEFWLCLCIRIFWIPVQLHWCHVRGTASAFHLLSNGFLNVVVRLGILQTVPWGYNKPEWCLSTIA